MWIRSQDKKSLAKANDIDIIDFDKEIGEIWIYVNDERYAVYSTKEKALKVLDEIQKLIYDYQLGRVFQMPQDDECWKDNDYE